MVEYKIIKSEEINFGNNNFIEVSRKKLISKNAEREFISIARGFILLNNQKVYKQSLTIPDSKEVIDFITRKLKEML